MNSDRVDLSEYVVISVWFGCNNDCTICMLSGMRQQLPPIGFEQYKDTLRDIIRDGKFKNLILSGAEVTTFADLEKYVSFAASLDWFEKIQIQTNGRRLSDREYLLRLVECGVNEFFISIHGTEEVQDAISTIPGSFRETMTGISNLSEYDVNVITNTVLTETNKECVTDLMSILSKECVSEIHMWNYFLMSSKDDDNMIVSLRDILDIVKQITAITTPSGKTVVLKAFPECLSCGPGAVIDSGYPVTVLPKAFWEKFGECGFGTCVHREKCNTEECWGLCHAYIHKFGDERDLLKPLRS